MTGYYPNLWGHAWTRFQHADPNNSISGYNYMTRNVENEYDNKYNKEAVDSLKAHLYN